MLGVVELATVIGGGSPDECFDKYKRGATSIAEAFGIRGVAAVEIGFFTQTIRWGPNPYAIMDGTAKLSAAQQRVVDKLESERLDCLAR